jgi:hypothetical protein
MTKIKNNKKIDKTKIKKRLRSNRRDINSYLRKKNIFLIK